jgi:tetratricopeptide (TPR) repeat protein
VNFIATTRLTKNQLFTVICLFLALMTLAVYWPVTGNDFINFDDQEYVTVNPHITSGLTWTNVIWAFESGEAANWHPLTWISHMIDCDLYGLNAGGHHLTNLLFHIANTLLLFLFLNEITGALWRSAFVAALFAWHPLHVESVAWAAERKDTLSAFFWILTLLTYVRFVQKSKAGNQKPELQSLTSIFRPLTSGFYWLALFFFACGLMSKPMVVTLPFVLLLLDFWPLGRIANFKFQIANLKIVLEKIPFFALALAGSTVTYLVQRTGGAFSPVSLTDRLVNALMAYARYLSKFFWPTNLSIAYPYQRHWPLVFAVGAALVLAVWSWLFVLKARQRPWLLMGWLWFLGTLVPTIGLVQVGAQSMADRYTYIPSIGLFIVVVWGVNDLFDLWSARRKFLPLAGALVLAGCVAVTSRQIGYWQNGAAIFSHAIEVTDNNYIAYNCLGKIFDDLGEKNKALYLFSEAVRIEPRYPPTQFNLATTLLEFGRTDEALEHFNAVAKLTPQDADAQYDIGTYFLLHDQPEKAAGYFANAIKDKPDFAEACNSLGTALLKQSKLDEAVAQFRETLRLKPDFAPAHLNLATALIKQGKSAEAITEFSENVRLHPADPDAHFNLGLALLDSQQFAGAAAQFSEDLRLAPNETKAHYRLAQVLSRQHKSSEAVAHYREAIRLTPDFPDALNELAWILATDPDAHNRSGGEAVKLAQCACDLTQNQQPAFLTTLAAAYAETGQFEEATACIQKSNSRATDASQKKIADKNEILLKLFQIGQPFHEPFFKND